MSSNGEIDVEQFASANPSGTVGDVREAAEFASGHVPGAGLIQTGQLAARMHDLDRMGPVYVICATGPRWAMPATLRWRATAILTSSETGKHGSITESLSPVKLSPATSHPIPRTVGKGRRLRP